MYDRHFGPCQIDSYCILPIDSVVQNCVLPIEFVKPDPFPVRKTYHDTIYPHNLSYLVCQYSCSEVSQNVAETSGIVELDLR